MTTNVNHSVVKKELNTVKEPSEEEEVSEKKTDIKNAKSYLTDTILYISKEDNYKLSEIFLQLFLIKNIETEHISYVYIIFKNLEDYDHSIINQWFNSQKEDYFHSVIFIKSYEWLKYINTNLEKHNLINVKLFLSDVIQTFENLKESMELDIKKKYEESELVRKCANQLKLANFIIIYFRKKELKLNPYYEKILKKILVNLKLISNTYKDTSSTSDLSLGLIYLQLYYLNNDILYFENSLKFLHKSNIVSNLEAKNQLGLIYYYGIGNITKNIEISYKYMLDSYNLGNIRACYYLSIINYEGKIISKNIYHAKNYLLTLIVGGFKTALIINTLKKYWKEDSNDLKYYILKSNENDKESDNYFINISFLYYYGLYEVENVRLKKIYLLTLIANGHPEESIIEKLKVLIADENDLDLKYFIEEFKKGNNKYSVFLGLIYYYILEIDDNENIDICNYWLSDIENSNKLALNHLLYYFKDKPNKIELIKNKSKHYLMLYNNSFYNKEEIDLTIKFSLIIYYNNVDTKNRNLSRKIWFKFIKHYPKCILYLKKSFCDFPEDLLKYNYMSKEKDPESLYYYGLIHKYNLTDLVEPSQEKALEYWWIILKNKDYYTQKLKSNENILKKQTTLIPPLELHKYEYFKQKAIDEIKISKLK
jgi:TPR repeat protein